MKEAADIVMKTCLDLMSTVMGEVNSIMIAAKACSDVGNPDAAMHIAMDAEPLLGEVNTLFACACLVRRRLKLDA